MRSMKTITLTIALLTILTTDLMAQRTREGYRVLHEIHGADTVMILQTRPVTIFAHPYDLEQYQRLIYNIKKVYPIALEANAILGDMEAYLAALPTEKDRKDYTRDVEKMLKKKYTPIIKKLTFSQGKILIKLIDRETSRTSFALVKELRGSLTAHMWQGLARLFGANLKDSYDPMDEDKVIEYFIQMYERGEL